MIAYLLACPWYFAFDASLDILSTLRFIPTSTRVLHGSSLINLACSLHHALRFDCKRAYHGASEHARRIEIDFKIETIHLDESDLMYSLREWFKVVRCKVGIMYSFLPGAVLPVVCPSISNVRPRMIAIYLGFANFI